MLIPHYLVLVVLWIAFVVLTFVAFVAILMTDRYPLLRLDQGGTEVPAAPGPPAPLAAGTSVAPSAGRPAPMHG